MNKIYIALILLGILTIFASECVKAHVYQPSGMRGLVNMVLKGKSNEYKQQTEIRRYISEHTN